jgi:hypothetical protein
MSVKGWALMTQSELVAAAAAFLIVIVITVLAQLGWLPAGRSQTVIVFAAGVGVSVCLRIGGIPPSWFSGSKAAFGMAAFLMLGAFVYRTPAERAFGTPLHLGIGLTLLGINIVQAIRNVL